MLFALKSYKYQFTKSSTKLLKNKQLHIIKDLMWDAFVFDFKNLLEDIDAVFEVAFDDKEIYNYSDLLRKPVLKPTKQNKRKQYQKSLKYSCQIFKDMLSIKSV